MEHAQKIAELTASRAAHAALQEQHSIMESELADVWSANAALEGRQSLTTGELAAARAKMASVHHALTLAQADMATSLDIWHFERWAQRTREARQTVTNLQRCADAVEQRGGLKTVIELSLFLDPSLISQSAQSSPHGFGARLVHSRLCFHISCNDVQRLGVIIFFLYENTHHDFLAR